MKVYISSCTNKCRKNPYYHSQNRNIGISAPLVRNQLAVTTPTNIMDGRVPYYALPMAWATLPGLDWETLGYTSR